MTSDHPLVARYLEKLSASLSQMKPPDRAEIVKEIGDHIADATAAGRPLDEVLTGLGSAEQLARAYEVDSLLHPKVQAVQSRSDRYLKLLGLVALGSLPTFIIVVTLGSVGLSLTFAGLAVLAAGILDAAGALPGWVQSDVEPWVAIAIGPVITVMGGLAVWGLVAYVRMAVRIVRRVLPGRRP